MYTVTGGTTEMVQRSRIQAYKHSFFISTIEPWNKLTVQTIMLPP